MPDETSRLSSEAAFHSLGNFHCVHTINNACVVAAALMHGKNDFEKVITIVVMGGLDTDCNGATAGSIAGVMMGVASILLNHRAYPPFNGFITDFNVFSLVRSRYPDVEIRLKGCSLKLRQ